MNRKKVGLDLGHGGIDSGATGNGYKEKDLVLQLGLLVKKKLEKNNIEVFLTRDRDKYVSLKDRTNYLNSKNVDVALSLHLNSASNLNAMGLEVFSYPNSINGSKFATKLLNDLIEAKLYTKNRGVKTANFHMVRETKSTAILPEFAFISNSTDINLFVNNINQFAEVTARSTVEFLGQSYVSDNNNLELDRPSFMLVENKTNLILLTEHIVLDYINKDNTNYIKIEDAYFSIREILESIDLEVGYKDGFITADVTKEFTPNSDSVDILLLNSKISVNTIKVDNQYYVNINKKLVPIRSIFESMGLKVSWNNANNMILVSRGV